MESSKWEAVVHTILALDGLAVDFGQWLSYTLLVAYHKGQ